MSDTAGRLLTLLSLLQTRRDWPGSELAERLGVSARTVRRDVEQLRELGYPVDATIGAIGGYRLAAGAAMPPLLLDDEEAVAIAVGLRTATGVAGIEDASVRALAKLDQVLPSRLRERVAAMHDATVRLSRSGPAVDPEILSVIAGTVRARESLRFAYRSRDGAPTRRLTEPHRLVSAGRHWYLVAWDADRADWRTFRVDRITEPHPTGVRTEPRELPGEDAAAFVLGAVSSSRAAYEADVTLHLSAEQAADRVEPGTAEIDPIDDHTCRLRTGAEDLDWLAVRLILLNADFEVHSPPELVTHLRKLTTRLSQSLPH